MALLILKTFFSFLNPLKCFFKVTYHVHPLLSERIENACDLGQPRSHILKKWENQNVDMEYLKDEIWFHQPPEGVTADNYRQVFETARWNEPFGEF